MTHKFSVGELARVAAVVEKEAGWDNTWEPPMSRLIENVGIVDRVDDRLGVRLTTSDYFFPHGSLELIRAASPQAVTEVN